MLRCHRADHDVMIAKDAVVAVAVDAIDTGMLRQYLIVRFFFSSVNVELTVESVFRYFCFARHTCPEACVSFVL